MSYSNYLKQLNEGYNKRPKKLRENKNNLIKNSKKLKESFESDDVYNDLLDRAMSIYNNNEHMDVDDIVSQAIDEGLIYDGDIFALADKYIRGSDIIDLFYEDLTYDLTNDVESRIDEEDIDEEDENLEESKKSSMSTSRNYGLKNKVTEGCHTSKNKRN